MRRMLALALVLCCVVGLSACAKNDQVEIAVDTLYNSKTKQSVSLLMERQAVEDLLGEGTLLTQDAPEFATAFPGIEFVSYGEGANFIAVNYKDGLVNELSNYSALGTAAPVASNWAMKDGLGYGTSKAAIVKAFGETKEMPIVTDPAVAEDEDLLMTTPGITWEKPVAMLYFFNSAGLRQEDGMNAETSVQMSLFVDDAKAGLLIYRIGVQKLP